MEVKADELSQVKGDIPKKQQSNGLLLRDREKWDKSQRLRGTI